MYNPQAIKQVITQLSSIGSIKHPKRWSQRCRVLSSRQCSSGTWRLLIAHQVHRGQVRRFWVEHARAKDIYEKNVETQKPRRGWWGARCVSEYSSAEADKLALWAGWHITVRNIHQGLRVWIHIPLLINWSIRNKICRWIRKACIVTLNI